MATFVDTTVKQIDTHLSELTHEVSRLEAARAALVGNGGSPARTPRRRRGRPRKTAAVTAAGAVSSATAPPKPRRRGRPRKTTTAPAATSSSETTKSSAPRRQPVRPGGQRAGNTRGIEALALVEKQPGITIPALAEAMKIQPNYLYRVLPKLAADGQVKRDGKGWHPAA
jgi:hypothetical protein